MKKILLSLLAVCVLSSSAFACNWFKPKANTSDIKTANLFNSKLSDSNTVWVGTFQLLWNDLCDNYVNGPIVFTNGQTQFAEELNKQSFNKSMISEDSYYTAHGVMTKSFKKQIEDALQQKFNDKSDILNTLNWDGKSFLAYAMLKKDFQFVHAFDVLPKEKFGKSDELVKYFGFQKKATTEQREPIRVMFYNSVNDFAIKINTKSNDKVVLYRTDSKASFEDIYNEMLNKSRTFKGTKSFKDNDKLKVPYLTFNTKHEFKELTGKHIKGTDLTIDSALQTVKFKMDNKGVQLKSEAAMIMRMSMLNPENEPPRYFYLNNNFVLFLIEEDKPYFALKVVDAAKLDK